LLRKAGTWIAALVAVSATVIGGIAAAAADQKLVLKDGSDHWVREYERKGDRVRFYSTERDEWEEIPDSLVDWKATEEELHKPVKLPADLEPEKKAPPPRRYPVAPGVALPASEGVFGYDGKNLLGMFQSQAELANDRSRQIVGSLAPIVKLRSFVELPGAASGISFSGSSPVIYVQLSNVSPADIALVRVKPKGEKRVVGAVLSSAITRSQTESQEVVEVSREQVAPAQGETPAIIRLTPTTPLMPGEYAVVEYVQKGNLNLFVWDFGYHPETGGKKSR
jgi:hypothetical protein